MRSFLFLCLACMAMAAQAQGYHLQRWERDWTTLCSDPFDSMAPNDQTDWSCEAASMAEFLSHRPHPKIQYQRWYEQMLPKRLAQVRYANTWCLRCYTFSPLPRTYEAAIALAERKQREFDSDDRYEASVVFGRGLFIIVATLVLAIALTLEIEAWLTERRALSAPSAAELAHRAERALAALEAREANHTAAS